MASGDLGEWIFDFVSAIQSLFALQLTIKPKLPSRDFAAIVAKFLGEERAVFTIPPSPIEGKTGKWKFNFELNHGSHMLVKALTATNSTHDAGFEAGCIRNAGCSGEATDEEIPSYRG